MEDTIYDEFDEEIIKKSVKKLEKLLDILGDMKQEEIIRLRKDNARFNRAVEALCEILGCSNPFWKMHPQYPGIKCSQYGQIEVVSSINCEVRFKDGVPFLHFPKTRRKPVMGALIILQCFHECPGPLNEYTVKFLDGDPTNVKLANLGWARKYVGT